MTASNQDGSFLVSGSDYDRFMGRYATPLAPIFADMAGVTPGMQALDVGCGPGALTSELTLRLGHEATSACDPSPPFVEECQRRNPDVTVKLGRAETIPFADDAFDVSMAQLVFHFVPDPLAAICDMRRVTRPDGTIAACVWDFSHGMEMLRAFWDAAISVDPTAPDEARTLRFGNAGEIASLFEACGLVVIDEGTLTVTSTYTDFDELWRGFLSGIGPAGSYLINMSASDQWRIHDALSDAIGRPAGSFTLTAVARAATGRVPHPRG